MANRIERLSSREFQVFSMLIKGLRSKEIADQLQLSQKTIFTHKAGALKKLEVGSVAEMVDIAYQEGFIEIKKEKSNAA